jgi:septum formation protein
MSTPLILASTSAARRTLLTNAGVTFEARAPGVDEAAARASLIADGVKPREIADALAELKALKVGRTTGRLTLGSDQTLELDGQCFDKPETLDALKTQLLMLRGRSHKLHAAAVLVEEGAPVWRDVQTATLTMRRFSDAFLDKYLEDVDGAVLGCVGGYHIEGLGLQLFDRMEGDYFTVLGLPMWGLLAALRQRGVIAE